VVTRLRVATWNVLAAPWAAPAYYTAEMDVALLDRVARRDLVARRIAALDADVVCLQETTPPDLDAIVAALGSDVAVHATANDERLWSDWSSPEVPWEPNGTAVLWRRAALDDVVTGALALSDDGNVATTVSARCGPDGPPVHVVSVHLDVDRPELRRAQLRTACGHLASVTGLTVVAGDCNEDTDGTDLGAIAAELGFVDALTAAGNSEPTHPLARPDDDWARLARLDHVLVRGGDGECGRVVDAGVWEVDDPTARLVEGLRRTGSDHLAVVTDLRASG
jgi:endonuclease/exonuclease/phosphatase family metal-dependent hydrolase